MQAVEGADTITANRGQCGGEPFIRGIRIRVVDIWTLLLRALAVSKILEAMPDLEREDIAVAVRYASCKLNNY